MYAGSITVTGVGCDRFGRIGGQAIGQSTSRTGVAERHAVEEFVALGQLLAPARKTGIGRVTQLRGVRLVQQSVHALGLQQHGAACQSRDVNGGHRAGSLDDQPVRGETNGQGAGGETAVEVTAQRLSGVVAEVHFVVCGQPVGHSAERFAQRAAQHWRIKGQAARRPRRLFFECAAWHGALQSQQHNFDAARIQSGGGLRRMASVGCVPNRRHTRSRRRVRQRFALEPRNCLCRRQRPAKRTRRDTGRENLNDGQQTTFFGQARVRQVVRIAAAVGPFVVLANPRRGGAQRGHIEQHGLARYGVALRAHHVVAAPAPRLGQQLGRPLDAADVVQQTGAAQQQHVLFG